MSYPLVSVIIPTYNRDSYLERAISSVLAQTYQTWELWIVDDGSTDHTEEMARRSCQQDPRIHYIKQTNTGVSVARNRGIARARGTYVAFLDDDDRWLPEKLTMQVAFMEDRPDLGMSYTRHQGTVASDQLRCADTAPARALIHEPATFHDLLRPFVSITPSRVLMRRECVEQAGGFNPSYVVNEDYDLWLRIAQRWAFAPVNRVLTVSEKDGRPTLSGAPIRNCLNGIQVLHNLTLISTHRRYGGLKRRHIAYLSYVLACEYYDMKQFWRAAKYFILALTRDPLVGLKVRRTGERGVQLLVRLAKAYAAVPCCLLRGLAHGAR